MDCKNGFALQHKSLYNMITLDDLCNMKKQCTIQRAPLFIKKVFLQELWTFYGNRFMILAFVSVLLCRFFYTYRKQLEAEIIHPQLALGLFCAPLVTNALTLP